MFCGLAGVLLLCALKGQAPNHRDPEWNQWRGPNRDGHSPDTGLLKQWPEGGPPLAWKATKIGAGFSSVTFAKDHIFTMGDVDESSVLLALNVKDGKIHWSVKVGEPGGGGGYPGPRCTPATDGKLVFALGQHGELVCVDAESGQERWRKHLKRSFDGKLMSNWGYCESPLLDGDHLICTPGGSKGTVLALKKERGDSVWQSEDLKDAAAYGSLIAVEIGGVRQYIVLTEKAVAGIDSTRGTLLWRVDRQSRAAVAATPIWYDGFVFTSASYEGGCQCFKVAFADGEFSIEKIYSGRQMTISHGGAIRVGNHVYSLAHRGLKCVELKTGKEVWGARSVGQGSLAYADGHFYAWGQQGKMALVEATPSGYNERGLLKPPGVTKRGAFAHPTVFGGKLYIRDQNILLCYDVKAK